MSSASRPHGARAFGTDGSNAHRVVGALNAVGVHVAAGLACRRRCLRQNARSTLCAHASVAGSTAGVFSGAICNR